MVSWVLVLVALTACGSREGACVLYGEDTGGGRYGCEIRAGRDCASDGETVTFHAGDTCQDLGFTEDCRGDEFLYEPEWCP